MSSSTGNRGYVNREIRLLSEFFGYRYRTAHWQLRVRLGSQTLAGPGVIEPGKNVPQAIVTQMWADGVVYLPTETQIWEAKVVLTGSAIGQLLEYRQAWPASPGLPPSASTNVTLHTVAARARQAAVDVAKQWGIEVALYAPAWLLADAAAWDTYLSKPILPASAGVS